MGSVYSRMAEKLINFRSMNGIQYLLPDQLAAVDRIKHGSSDHGKWLWVSVNREYNSNQCLLTTSFTFFR